MLAVNVTLQRNIYPQNNPPPATKADFDAFAGSASATRASEKCSIITYRKSTTSFRLVPKSVTLNNLERRNGLMLHNFIIILNHGRVVLFATVELNVCDCGLSIFNKRISLDVTFGLGSDTCCLIKSLNRDVKNVSYVFYLCDVFYVFNVFLTTFFYYKKR